MNIGKFLPHRVKRFFNVGDEEDENADRSDKDQQIELKKITPISDEEQNNPSSQNEENKVNQVTINKCENLSNALELFDSSSIRDGLNKIENVSMFKFEITDNFEALDSTELAELSRICIKNSVVIFFASESNEIFSIYWKSNQIENLLTYKSYDSDLMRTSRMLYEFIAEFFIKSLKNNHLGLRKLDIKHEATEFELHFLADHREYNILIIAAEMGDSAVVEILMQLDIVTESPYKDINAQSVAYHGQHFHVLLLLLHKNLTFPVEMDIEKCSIEVQNFVQMCNKLHDCIKENDIAKVIEIVQENSHILYFYNTSNDSASTIALSCNNLEIYETLIINGIYFGPYENTVAIMGQLEHETQIAVREIHFKHLKETSETHLHYLITRSSVGHDVPHPRKKINIVRNAFNILNAIPLIRIILMVVAASQKYRIIFDFNRDTVHVVDPTSDSYTNGVFYTSGRIYIGAKQLLDSATKYIALGTLAHELCHYALNLAFKNEAKPYRSKDKKSKKEFDDISKYCKENCDNEEIVRYVYECYPKDMFHAELAVRASHLLAFYHEQPEKLLESRKNFSRLFDFIEEKVVPQMIEAIPAIESAVDIKIKKQNKEIAIWTWAIRFTIVFFIILSVLTGYYFYTPIYKFSELSELKQNNIRDANVLYKNVSVKFKDLYSDNSIAYNRLTSAHISKILNGVVLNFNDIHLFYLDDLVVIDAKNLTENLKQKVFNSSLNFQGQDIKFMDLSHSYLEAFKVMTPEQIKDLLNGKVIVVGEKLESNVDFYAERYFIPEDYFKVNFEYLFGYEVDYTVETFLILQDRHVKNRTLTLNKTFEQFSEEFFLQNFDSRWEILDKVNKNLIFKSLVPQPPFENFKFMYKNSTKIIEKAENEKFFILSSEAGAGKTVSFKFLTIELKLMFPTHWVSYIDLKDHAKKYKTNGIAENVQELLENMLNLNSENELERKIFSESFKSGNVVLLWNGYDEISPTYSEFILNVMTFIQKNTKNIQFVCTRPLYSKELSRAFDVYAWQLVPFNDIEIRQFLRNIFISQNISNENINGYIQKVQEIIESFQFSGIIEYKFTTPLMLRVVTVVHKKELSVSGNIYEIFELFIDEKINIWSEKKKKLQNTGAFIWNHVKELKKIFKKYSMLNSLILFSQSTMAFTMHRLEIMQIEIHEYLTHAEISSIGILYLNDKNEYEFAHKTFSEFFIAQYFIENIYNAEGYIDNDEAELRLQLFFCIFQSYGLGQKIMTDFMIAYLEMNKKSKKLNESKIFNPKFSELLRTKFKFFLFRLLDINDASFFKFLFDFFQKDHELLVDLLRVNSNETLYTAMFNPNYFSVFSNPTEIKDYAKLHLNAEEFENFTSGRNQKGKILFGMHFYKLHNITKTNIHYDLETEEVDDIPYWNFFSKVNDSLTLDEQKELFITATSPKIYLYYSKLFKYDKNSGNNLTEYENLWENSENLFTQIEIQEILGNALIQYFEIFPNDKIGQDDYLQILIEKVEKYLTDSQIYEIFSTKNIFHEAVWDIYSIRTLWTFFSNHTNIEEQRNILIQDDLDDKNFYFVSYMEERKKELIFYNTPKYSYFDYDFTPFKVLHRVMTIPTPQAFKFVTGIYEEHFNKTEIQDIILSSSDLIYYTVCREFYGNIKQFNLFLEANFEGNEKSLKEYLERKIKSTDLTVFEYVNNLRGLKFTTGHWYKNIDFLTDFYEKIKEKVISNDKELKEEGSPFALEAQIP